MQTLEHSRQDEQVKDRTELLGILAKSEEDVKCGRVAPVQDTFNDLRKMLTD